MTMTETTRFFQAGGTLKEDIPSYVKRPADEELFAQVVAGQFCYILTSRQMGKSSLVARTATRLRQRDIRTAVIDLSALGQIAPEPWYLGMLEELVQQLQLDCPVEAWWQKRAGLGVVQRFTSFLREVVLPRVSEPVVIFIDEIDSTLSLDFTDDFFAAIRSTYNQRASNSEYKRLTFVLLGVAMPDDLIKDPTRTPFNIGHAIALHEFSRADAQVLQDGLEHRFPGCGTALLDRVFSWTSGHPYLTQKLCMELASHSAMGDLPRQVDELVTALFFAGDTRSENHVKLMRSSIEQRSLAERQRLLRLYAQIYHERPVPDDEQSLLQNQLKLLGLVRTQEDRLVVRNQIYRQVFNQSWITQQTPGVWERLSTWQKITVSATSVSVVVIVGLFLLAAWQTAQTIHTQQVSHAQIVQEFSDPATRLNSLYELCKIEHQQVEQPLFYGVVAWFTPRDRATSHAHDAQHLFYQRTPDEQEAMFQRQHAQSYRYKLDILVVCLYPPDGANQPGTAPDEAVAQAMCCALQHIQSEHYRSCVARFAREFDRPCRCREWKQQ